MFVGLLNMFPVLPFDGGHAAIATYERLRSRRGKEPYRADITKMIPVAMAMMAVLAMLFVTGFYLDFAKPLPLSWHTSLMPFERKATRQIIVGKGPKQCPSAGAHRSRCSR